MILSLHETARLVLYFYSPTFPDFLRRPHRKLGPFPHLTSLRSMPFTDSIEGGAHNTRPSITAVHLFLQQTFQTRHPSKKAVFKNNPRSSHERSRKRTSHIFTPLYTPADSPTQRHNDRQMANQRKSKPDLKCKKHPKHRQSPGVCSLCLTEKLSQLSSRRTAASSATVGSSCPSSSASSLSSYYSSSSASSCSSPLRPYRFVKEGKASISFLFNGKNVLTKSRSVAFFPRTKNIGDDDDDKKKKKGGFWSKLLRPRSKRMEETLMHSRTMREREIII